MLVEYAQSSLLIEEAQDVWSPTSAIQCWAVPTPATVVHSMRTWSVVTAQFTASNFFSMSKQESAVGHGESAIAYDAKAKFSAATCPKLDPASVTTSPPTVDRPTPD